MRLGHPARVLPELRAHTLDLLVERHPDVRLARKLVKQALSLFREADRYTRAAPKPGQRRQLREDAKSLLADARRLEMQAVESILGSASVLCATTTGLDSQVLGTRRFDLAVIDEACQSTEPGCWIPLAALRPRGAGRRPLPVAADRGEPGGGGRGFRREPLRAARWRCYGPQHRPAAEGAVPHAPGDHGVLVRASSTTASWRPTRRSRGHLLADLPGVAAVPLTQSPLEFIDTAGAGFDEELEPDGESRLNRQEAELVRPQGAGAAGLRRGRRPTSP